MNEIKCPVCNSLEHQSFWFWEKEDKLMRNWAVDTKVHFSICRSCTAIFQNPMIDTESSEDAFMASWDMDSTTQAPPDEPLDWIQQFGGTAKQPGKALEVYSKGKRYENYMQQLGWEIKTISINHLLQNQSGEEESLLSDKNETDADDPFSSPSAFGDIFTFDEGINASDRFDLILCTDALSHTSRPVEVLKKLHSHTKDDGTLILEQDNPFALPRIRKICLTSDELCILPLHSLIFALYKAGFTNTASEMCGRIRCLATKIESQPDADASQLIPKHIWEQIIYKFQRNYYWMWVTTFLENYRMQSQTNPNLLEETRKTLHQKPFELHCIRDVCGACLLFVEEVTTLRNSLAEDWPMTLHRIFEIWKNDYVLFDLLRMAQLDEVGTFQQIERFFFNEKMIYLTSGDYFQRFFSEEEARRLCDSIIRAGQQICGQLSSFL